MLIILDGILGSPESDSLIRRVEGFQRLGEVSSLTRLSIPECETIEAMLLGLAPEEGQLRQGPLTVSALGWDPPERSLHFHLSLLSLQDAILAPKQQLTPEEFAVIKSKLDVLKTKKLTTLVGYDLPASATVKSVDSKQGCKLNFKRFSTIPARSFTSTHG